MSNTSNTRLLTKNRLLAALPDSEAMLLKPHLEPVTIAPGTIVFQAGDEIRYVYFPHNGMVSLLSVTEQGQTVEIGFAGYEGMVGLPVLLGQREMPYRAMVQVKAECFRIEANTSPRFSISAALSTISLCAIFTSSSNSFRKPASAIIFTRSKRACVAG
jgi:CRP-like cAMP-binding protein